MGSEMCIRDRVNAASDDVIRIAPAYVVSEKQIMSFVSAFNSSCEEIYRG